MRKCSRRADARHRYFTQQGEVAGVEVDIGDDKKTKLRELIDAFGRTDDVSRSEVKEFAHSNRAGDCPQKSDHQPLDTKGQRP